MKYTFARLLRSETVNQHRSFARPLAFAAALLAAAAIALPAQAIAGAVRPGFNAFSLSANDDGSTPSVPLGFTANYFGTSRTTAFVNNNGNITFSSALSSYTPFPITTTGREIIAPFFADVDTRGAGSGIVRYSYGIEMVDGHVAFGANWVNVGYYSGHFDKLNSFQVVLISRSDIGVGDFDIEFNYDKIQWEAGDASGGSAGLGGTTTARAGYASATGNTLELAGSGVAGRFLDTNLVSGLIRSSLNSSVLGRYVFQVRNGVVTVNSPVASAGLDQTVNEGANVVLNGTASHDTNSPLKPITYAWSQVSGQPVTLLNPNSSTPSFTAPSVPRAGAVLVFNLTVSNGVTAPTSDQVNINVANVNTPPTANAGTEKWVNENSFITLSGSGSDPDGDALTLTWTQTGGPAVTLDGSDTPAPTFTAPPVSFAQGMIDLTFRLVVNDGLISSGPSTVVIHVLNINAPPTADAGQDQSVNELDSVALDGTQSTDPDNDALTYAWVQIGGLPLVALSGANTATPSFHAPAVAPGGTTLTFKLTVNDGELSGSASVNVRISNVNHVPIADAGVDQTVPEGTPVSLDGSASADTDGDALTYVWVQTGGPGVALSGDATASPTFVTPDVGGTGAVLKFKLTVDDSYGGVASDEVAVNVTYVNHPPTANAGDDQTVNEGGTATLAGAASDPDGNPLTYAWTQVSGPAASLSDSAAAAPTFAAPLVTRAEDDIVFHLEATDGYGGSAGDDVTIHIANINHPPVADAPANQSVTEGSDVSLIGTGTDPDSEEQSQLTYRWQQISPVIGTCYATSSLSFTAPLVTAGGDPDAKEVLVFRLTVIDPNGAHASDDVTVSVTNVEHAPTAVAGGSLNANEAASVTLNGSASSDPDGDALTYSWVQCSGPAVTLSEANTAYPYFTAPFTSAAGATLKFKLTVNDGFGGTSSDTATVTVININDPPTAAAAAASLGTLWPPDHRMVAISILGVIDVNNNATIRITRVTQDEPTNGLGDGDTAIDAIISADGTSVLVRSERSGKGDGRVYRISFTAGDLEGSVSGVVKVGVPHSKKTDPIVDSGGVFISTQ